MPIVKVTTSYPAWPLARQTPGDSARWGDWQFVINQPINDCDAWVVLDDLRAVERCQCPANRTMLINLEPPTHSGYDARFLVPFAVVAACGGHGFAHPNVRESFPPQPWYFGLDFSKTKPNTLANRFSFLTYEQIATLKPSKTKELSVVCSNKHFTEGQRHRLAFVERLKAHFGERLDWFGAGVRPITDKAQAVLDYRYHIAIENGSFPHYWTEKLADPYLGWAMPVYCGCPNVTDYFDERAMLCVDIAQPDEAIKRIEQAMAEDLWRNSLPALAEARRLVLERYNLFPFIIDLLKKLPPATERQPITLRPNAHHVGRVRSALRRLRAKMQFGLGVTKLFPALRKL